MRIVNLDLETSPIISFNWGIYEQNAIEVVQDWQILCFAYKWLDEKRAHVIGQDDFKNYVPGKLDDKNVVEAILGILEAADVVIGHNSDQFDLKKINARLMFHGFPPPSPYKKLDTKKIARKYAGFTSNKLDDLGDTLSIGRKLQTGGFETWKGCMRGEPKAWRKMKRYNRQDVLLDEQVYLKFLPWIDNHPSVSLADGKPDNCPKCGEGPMRRRGLYYTKVAQVVNYQCMNCLGYSKQRMTIKTAQHYVN